jgi:hypothetical protein
MVVSRPRRVRIETQSLLGSLLAVLTYSVAAFPQSLPPWNPQGEHSLNLGIIMRLCVDRRRYIRTEDVARAMRLTGQLNVSL